MIEIVQKSIQEYELIVEDNEDVITWEDENRMKGILVDKCDLHEWVELYDIENLYVYEMFEWDLSEETLKDMAYIFIELLDEYK